MPYYRSVGDIPPKRHTQHRATDGSLLFEELTGSDGFSADSSLLYHRNQPAQVLDVRPWALPDQALHANDPFLPRHIVTHRLFTSGEPADAVTGRRVLLGNEDVRLAYVVATRPSPLYRNAIGDECLFVEDGAATVESTFGDLVIRQGDYVILPRGVDHAIVPTGDEPLRLYVIEASARIRPPRRFLSPTGQFLEHAPYCERDLRPPSAPRFVDDGPTDVHIKHRGNGAGGVSGTVYTFARHPFDVVGWDGCRYPYAFSIHDYEPITGRIHQPPPSHQVFESDRFVVCNFVPRKVDYHPLAIPAPYYHANVDSDEVIFYAGGNYAARRGSGIGQGSVSLHPGGHTHGPHPGAYERSIGVEAVDELAVMVDTFAPLHLGAGGLEALADGYERTWSTPLDS